MSDNLFSASVLAVITTMAIAVGVSVFQPGVLPAKAAAAQAPRVIQLERVTVVARRLPAPIAIDVAAAY